MQWIVMSNQIQKHFWADISDASDEPGVYAWYYNPEITDFDLDKTIQLAQKATTSEEAEKIIRDTLEERLFRYFREEPYTASISGPLKPAYVGSLEHKSGISSSLVSRIAANPERLRNIRDTLTQSAPLFASPLYIGMASKLRRRLSRHKALIEEFRSLVPRDINEDVESDAGFALQVAKRKIPPERLFVVTCSMPSSDGTQVDIENILNRIYYPILGRN